jgi:hypothetical protein
MRKLAAMVLRCIVPLLLTLWLVNGDALGPFHLNVDNRIVSGTVREDIAGLLQLDSTSILNESVAHQWRQLWFVSMDPRAGYGFLQAHRNSDLTAFDSLHIPDWDLEGLSFQQWLDRALPYSDWNMLPLAVLSNFPAIDGLRSRFTRPPLDGSVSVLRGATRFPGRLDYPFDLNLTYFADVGSTRMIDGVPVEVTFVDPLNPYAFRVSICRVFDSATSHSACSLSRQVVFDPQTGDELVEADLVSESNAATDDDLQSFWSTPLRPHVTAENGSVVVYAHRLAQSSAWYATSGVLDRVVVCRVAIPSFGATRVVDADSESRLCDAVTSDRLYVVWEDSAVSDQCLRDNCVVSRPKLPTEVNNSRQAVLKSTQAEVLDPTRAYIRAGDAISFRPEPFVDALGPLGSKEVYFVQGRMKYSRFSADPTWMERFHPSSALYQKPQRKLLAFERTFDVAKETVTLIPVVMQSANCATPDYDANGTFIGCECDAPVYAADGSFVTCAHPSLASYTLWVLWWVFFSVFVFVCMVWIVLDCCNQAAKGYAYERVPSPEPRAVGTAYYGFEPPLDTRN